MGEVLRILIADDDMDICRIWRNEIEKFFDKSGQKVEVFEAYDGDSAWNMFIEVKPDLVILDVMMPVQNGWETCRKIRALEKSEKLSPPTIILIVSGIGPHLNEMTSPLYGADDYIDKPLQKRILTKKIQQLLEGREERIEIEIEKENEGEKS